MYHHQGARKETDLFLCILKDNIFRRNGLFNYTTEINRKSRRGRQRCLKASILGMCSPATVPCSVTANEGTVTRALQLSTKDEGCPGQPRWTVFTPQTAAALKERPVHWPVQPQLRLFSPLPQNHQEQNVLGGHPLQPPADLHSHG